MTRYTDCMNCGRPDAKSACGGCNEGYYCNETCRRIDLVDKSDTASHHKFACKELMHIRNDPTLMTFLTAETEKVEIRKSNTYGGRGLFAKQKIRRGEVVAYFFGSHYNRDLGLQRGEIPAPFDCYEYHGSHGFIRCFPDVGKGFLGACFINDSTISRENAEYLINSNYMDKNGKRNEQVRKKMLEILVRHGIESRGLPSVNVVIDRDRNFVTASFDIPKGGELQGTFGLYWIKMVVAKLRALGHFEESMWFMSDFRELLETRCPEGINARVFSGGTVLSPHKDVYSVYWFSKDQVRFLVGPNFRYIYFRALFTMEMNHFTLFSLPDAVFPKLEQLISTCSKLGAHRTPEELYISTMDTLMKTFGNSTQAKQAGFDIFGMMDIELAEVRMLTSVEDVLVRDKDGQFIGIQPSPHVLSMLDKNHPEAEMRKVRMVVLNGRKLECLKEVSFRHHFEDVQPRGAYDMAARISEFKNSNEKELKALTFKEEGTKAFKAKDFKRAIEEYTKAAELSTEKETRKACYSNTAQCHLLLKQYQEALKAAEASIEIDPEFMKSWFRKGLALSNLDQGTQAIVALTHALRLDPTNAEVKAALETAKNSAVD